MLQTILRRPQIADDVALGAQLSAASNRPFTPQIVAQVLTAGGVKYVLIGGHAINGYTGRPRATVDVDVIVQHPKKAAKVISAAFPRLTVQDTAVVIRFKDGENEVIDLIKPNTSKLWPQLLRDARPIKIEGVTLQIPSLEGMLAAKFSAMISVTRRLADREQDAVDFRRAVEANPEIDLAKIGFLGNLVFPKGGSELLDQIAAARAGKPLKL